MTTTQEGPKNYQINQGEKDLSHDQVFGADPVGGPPLPSTGLQPKAGRFGTDFEALKLCKKVGREISDCLSAPERKGERARSRFAYTPNKQNLNGKQMCFYIFLD